MKGKTVLIVLIAVVATAASTFVATRAITGTVQDGRTAAASAETEPGEIQSKGTEVAMLVDNIEESSDEEAVTREDRDPLSVFKRKITPKREDPKPKTDNDEPVFSWPSYKVTAVMVGDADPRAFMALGGKSISVKIGDQITGGMVMSIESDGVTIEGEAGTKKYPF